MNSKIILICSALLLTWSCEKEDPILDNPLDPDNPQYDPPSVVITSGPSEGEIIDTSVVIFTWEGNELSSSYRTKFNGGNWSSWVASTTQTFDYLDEGDHSFYVQSQYSSGDTSEIVGVTFSVDAVKGPALIFYPRRHIASVGDTVSFQILAEEVDSLTAVEFLIRYDPIYLEIISATQGSIFTNSGESIFHSEIYGDTGKCEILTAMLGGSELFVTGTADIVQLEIVVLSEGFTNIIFANPPIFRDPQNNNITLNQTVVGIIEPY